MVGGMTDDARVGRVVLPPCLDCGQAEPSAEHVLGHGELRPDPQRYEWRLSEWRLDSLRAGATGPETWGVRLDRWRFNATAWVLLKLAWLFGGGKGLAVRELADRAKAEPRPAPTLPNPNVDIKTGRPTS